MTMRTYFFIIWCLFSILVTYAQQPKGERILAWQVDMTENANYDSAFAYAQRGCMESIHLTFSWDNIEPSDTGFDSAYLNDIVDIANIYYPAYGVQVELQIPTMNTNVKTTPTDLKTTDFDHPVMIKRFKVFLDTLFAHIPDIDLSALNMGNESDIYMGTDATQYTQYKTFLDSVIPYAKELYFNLHQSELKVGTTLTFDGITTASTKALCKNLNDDLDIVAVTYYPLNSDFTMKSPEVVKEDFDALVKEYTDTSQPIYFVECGYASSENCNSSEEQQAEFYQHVFTAWDTHKDHIKYLTLFKTTDWSSDEIEELDDFYNLNDTIFLEYLRTLGVRTWEGDGEDKEAYSTILCELHARGWCEQTTPCIVAQTETQNSKTSRLAPNPSHQQVKVMGSDAIAHIDVFNMIGQTMYVKEGQIMDISHLPEGMYIVSIEYTSGVKELIRLVKE